MRDDPSIGVILRTCVREPRGFIRPDHRRLSPMFGPWCPDLMPHNAVSGFLRTKEERWILRCIHYSTGIFCSLSTPKKNTTGLSSCPPSTSSQRTPSRYAHTSQITHKLTQKQRSEELLALGTPQSQQQAFDNLVEVFQS